jgi:MFS family permease
MGERGAGYGWYVVGVLTLTQALAFVDRHVLALLVEPIKRDLHASDTVISLLYGLSFALFYVIVAIPIARLADRSNRRNIVAISLAVWSLMTALCGLARTLPQLVAARLGVGAGEAGLSPSAQSLLADYFPDHRLPAALGVFSMGVSLGGGLALLAGGALLAAAPGIAAALGLPGLSPWRLVMVGVGLPGLMVALLFLTVREPARGAGRREAASGQALLAWLWTNRWTYLGLIGALSLIVFVSNAASAWIPALFERRFGWTGPEVGARYGPIVLICGAAGALAGGLLASALRRRGVEGANLKASLAGFLLAAPLAIAFPLAPSPWVALTLIGLMVFCGGLPSGGGYAALQEATPARLRAQVTALNGLAVNLIGAGLGPLAVALLTDRLFHDPLHLPWAMSLTELVASPLAIAAYLLAMRRRL